MARRSRRLGLFVATGLLIATGQALAQGGAGGPAAGGGRGGDRGGGFGGFGGGGFLRGMGMAQMFEPAVSNQDLDKYVAMLGMDAAQKDAARALLEAYQQEFTASAKAARAKLDAAREAARDSGDWSAMRDIQEDVQKFRRQGAEMESALLGDLTALLTEGQAEKWPALERMRRRERTLGRGLISGERVDVIRLVGELELSEDAKGEVAPILEQYEQDLDRELIQRNQVYEEAQERFRELMQGGDQDAIDKLFNKGRDAGVRVREVNRRFARQVEAALPEEKRLGFALAVQRESYPQIYRPTYAQRVVDAAGALEGLSEEQRTAIAAVREGFTRDLGAMNKQLAAATEERELTVTPRELIARARQDEQGKVEELTRERRAMMSETVEKVRSILTEEQREKLPARDQRAEGRPERRGEGDDQPQRPRRRARPAEEEVPVPTRDG